jgi:hypothetical protein
MNDDIQEALESICTTATLGEVLVPVRWHNIHAVKALIKAFLTELPDDSLSVRELLEELEE